jgi:hypothetical protein
MIEAKSLTLREVAAIEQAAGVPMDRWDQAPSKALLYAATLWQLRLRADPAATLDQALDMGVDALSAELSEVATSDVDPTVPAGPSTSPSD